MKKIFTSIIFTAILFIVPYLSACELCGNPNHIPTLLIANSVFLPTVNIGIGGDFRFRYQVNDENNDCTDSQFYRARLALGFNAGKASAAIRLISDQEIDGSTDMNSENIYVDVAAVAFHITKEISITGGKSPVRFFRPNGSELMFDDDIRLEGFAAEFSRKYDDMSVLVTAGHYNNLLTGGQLVLNLKDILKLDITAGAGYYKYNMDNNKEVFVEVVPFGLPVTLTGDYTWSDSLNLKDNESWLAGFEIGKKPVSVYANYRSLNSKSVNMDLTDDDFIDDGHEVGVKYQFTENVMTDVNILTKDFDDKNYRIKTDLIFQF